MGGGKCHLQEKAHEMQYDGLQYLADDRGGNRSHSHIACDGAGYRTMDNRIHCLSGV